MFDLSKSFKREQGLFLEEVRYNISPVDNDKGKSGKVFIDDTVSAAKINEKQIKLNFTRSLKVGEDAMSLKVKFGAILTISENDTTTDWDSIDLAEEFKNTMVLSNMIGRVSLIISQLTSSYGVSPIITPPSLMQQT